jgi:hypothetical protein
MKGIGWNGKDWKGTGERDVARAVSGINVGCKDNMPTTTYN